jgi:alpha-tubulin suppressor-like RCC1 family protein
VRPTFWGGAALAVWVLCAVGCYSPGLGDCAVQCTAAATACPSGLTCDVAEGYCQASVASVCGLVPGDDGGTPDAPVVPPGDETYTAIAVGEQHSCAVRDDKTMWCWGRGEEGQLGDGLRQRRARPVQVDAAGPADWLSVKANGFYTCGLRGTALPAELWCWGENANRQIEDTFENVDEPVLVVGGPWLDFALGAGTTCAIDPASHLWCWGSNGFHIRGPDDNLEQQPLLQIDSQAWKTVAVDLYHGCAIGTDGALSCWGSQGESHLLGHEPAEPALPSTVIAATDWEAISIGELFNCGIRRFPTPADRTLWCWGSDGGNLGDGSNNGGSVETPKPIGTAKDWKDVSVGKLHGCGVRAESTGDHLYCWGLNPEGELGTGSLEDEYAPVRVGAAADAFESVRVGPDFGCALRSDGAIFCFGDDAYGQLGDGVPAIEPAPARVGGAVGWSQVSGDDYHTCAIRLPDELYCWGRNDFGQAGEKPSDAWIIPAPHRIEGSWSQVSVGMYHSCAIDTAGKLKCWGANASGELGINAPTNFADHPIPTAVVGGASTWAYVAAGYNVGCGIGAAGAGANAGKLYCWGNNTYLQLGRESFGENTPKEVVGGFTDWKSLSIGGASSCGLRPGGGAGDTSILCWGLPDHGQLGGGAGATATFTPTAIASADANWASGDSGFLQHCGLQDDGDLYCWGSSSSGQLGNGSGDDALSPTRVSLDARARAFGTGGEHGCAVLETGELACWGLAEEGQLGDGLARPDFVYTPAVVGDDTDWDRLGLGAQHSCAIKLDGSLWCWGRNTWGQLGTGSPASLLPGRIADPAE